MRTWRVCEVSSGMVRNGGRLQLSPVVEKRAREVQSIQECEGGSKGPPSRLKETGWFWWAVSMIASRNELIDSWVEGVSVLSNQKSFWAWQVADGAAGRMAIGTPWVDP